MAKTVKIGIVGAGSISLRGIMPHLSQEDVKDRVKMTAVCDPVPGRAQAAAEKFGVPNAYEKYEDLLAAGNVDAVTIASPIGIHYEQGRMAIEHGVHVHFCKTMTTTVKEADELIAFAKKKRAKIVASPGEMLRPLHRKVRQLVLNGTLGNITWSAVGMASGTMHEQESIRQGSDVLSNINPAWYYRKPGGGPLYDMTVYGLHALTGVLGPAKRVTSFSGIRIPTREFRDEEVKVDMDDNTFMLLDFGNAMCGFVYGAAAGTLPIVGPLWYPFVVFGTKGFVHGNTLNWWKSMMDFTTEPIKEMEGVKGEYGKANIGLPHVTGVHAQMQESHVFEDIMQLVDWIREDKPTIVTAEHARHVIEIIEAAYRSSETGKAQTLQTTFKTIS